MGWLVSSLACFQESDLSGKHVESSDGVMDAYDHFHDEDQNYYPEVIIVFLFMMLIGCIAGAAIVLLVYSIMTGFYV